VLKNLTLFATTRCDLKCVHCLRGYPTSHNDFPLDLLPNLLDEARLFGAQHVGLTGGEPSLHPQFERLTDIILEAYYTLSFVSNGQDVKPYLAVFERYPGQVTSVALSLDDADPAGHDRNRGKPGAFEAVMASGRILVSAGCRVYFKARAHSREQMEAVMRLAKETGAFRIQFGGIIPAEWNRETVLKDDEALALVEFINDLKSKESPEIRSSSSLYAGSGIRGCDVFDFHTLNFNARGEMIFCCDINEEGMAEVLGRLGEQSLVELIGRWLRTAAELQTEPTRRIARGEMGEGFDTCAFCNQYFRQDQPV